MMKLFMDKVRQFGLYASFVFLAACGGGGSSNHGGTSGGPGSPAAPVESELNDITPFVTNSVYSNVLKTCVLAETAADGCSLTDLPLIQQDAENPGVDDIMSRVLVSHQWMGLRFQQVLETMPDELLHLFSAVTTIVIDAQIRPSSYQPETSTIYIDPDYLWLTNSEKLVIDKTPDYRSDFGDELAFISLVRFVEGFNYAWDYYSLEDTQERTLEDIRMNTARVLLHELLHANDFFPPMEAPYLSQNQTIYQAYELLSSKRISTLLSNTMPLESPLLKSLAMVMYQGSTANEEEKQLTAQQVGEAFEEDGASDDYAYSTIEEDAAMLFSETMMKYLFSVDRDIAFVKKPTGNNPTCDDYIVEWGVRGRIGDYNVKDRAQYVVQNIYPDRDFSLFFQNLPIPLFMRVGEGWCDNIALF